MNGNKFTENVFALGHPIKEPQYGLRFIQALKGCDVNVSYPPFVLLFLLSSHSAPDNLQVTKR